MKFSIKLLILYQLVLNSALADIVTTPIRSMPSNSEGHNEPVNSIAISPDGSFALSGSSDGAMKMWELSSGAEIRSFVGHNDTKNSIGQAIIIAAGGNHRSNTLFPYTNEYTQRFYKLLKEQGYTDEQITYMNPKAPDLDNDGVPEYKLQDYALFDPEKELTLAFQQAAQNYGKQFILYLHGHARKNHINITPAYDLSANHLKTLLAMIPTNIQQIIIMDTCYSGSFIDELSQPGRIIISSTDDNSISWKIKEMSFSDTFLLSLRRGMNLMEAFKKTENMILEDKQLFGDQRPWIDDNGDGIYNVEDGKQATKIQIGKELSVLRSIDISPDGRYGLSGSADKTMKLWELSNGSEIRNFAGHTDGIYSVSLSPDGRYALSGSADKTMKLWELSTGAEIRSFIGHNSGIMSVAISADGRYALSGSSDAAMKLWELSTGAEVRSFIGHASSVNSVTFSSDSHYALSGSSDKTMKLWDISTGSEIHSFAGHTESITSVAFSPDGRYVYSGSGDGTLKMWDSGIIKPKGLGQAIIIAAGGGQKGNSLYKFSNEYTQRFYRILKERGYKDEQIAYMNPQAPDLNEDGYLENELLDYQLFNPEQELTTAFQQAAQNFGEQFIFYLHGHARPEHFRIKPDYELSASHLQTLLAQIPSSIPQILILDSCYSGSFFNKLKQPGRILISSADNQSLAWSDKNASFADNFLFNLRRGFNLSEAFTDTKLLG
ncbi:WD40 repeat domain-containing protein [Candidatus Marithrix sp. Canyon 246]|uniref:WD40 repeat domain-containing protein n=1 Tax=Candidatus Marithrix sp. Canyon 246 TaxID=1827136 RepID=UPI00084A08E7|nr:WD40 repeat domain-containing protein [Candidatus Marithrix sp. Canyon 246]